MTSPVRDAKSIWYLDSVEYRPVSEHYRLGRHTFRVLDSTGLYSPTESSPHYLLLTGSPRIHMERFLLALNPGQVIADGSNYKSLVERWKHSCKKLEIPFHSTSDQGAFIQQVRLEKP